MGRWAQYRRRGTAPNWPLPPPGAGDWTITDIGDGTARVAWVGAVPPGADRYVVRGDSAGGGLPFVTALTPFGNTVDISGLDPDNYWAQISLWDFTSTVQLSPWSAEKLFVIA